jgi:transaldolase
MKIYLASANLEDIRWAASRRLIDGVLTTHALVGAEEPEDAREHLSAICRTSNGPVFVTAHALTSDEVYRDARELAKLSDTIVVQIPFVEDVVDSIQSPRHSCSAPPRRCSLRVPAPGPL